MKKKGVIEKYPRLFSLVKCILTSEQCATERGFFINKIMLDSYGYCMQENTIDIFCLVKDELLRIGGVMKFNITADLILEVKGAYRGVKESLFGVILVRIFPGFPLIRAEYGKILRISPYSVRMWENSAKNQTRITPNTDSFYAVYRKYIADLEQRKAMEDAVKWDKEKTKNGAKNFSRR